MISSMTGYGRSYDQNDSLNLFVEVKSVNSRFLDLSSKLPKILVPFEDEALKIIKKTCIRGRVTLFAKIEYGIGEKKMMKLNHHKFQEYMGAVEEIQLASKKYDFPSIGEMLRFPDIFVNEEPDNEDELKNIFLKTLNNALFEMQKNRDQEGKNIEIDIVNRLQTLQLKSEEIDTLTKKNKHKTFKEYKKKIQDLTCDNNIDELRLYQEIAILAEKKDITEELVRLNSHYELFQAYIKEEVNNGKKINFLLQEIGREINTVASKTDVIEISHLAVDIKDELEKIREQVQNII